MKILRNKKKVFSTERYLMIIENFGSESDQYCRIVVAKPGFNPSEPFNVDMNGLPLYRTIEQEELTVFPELNEITVNKMHYKFDSLI